MDDLISRQAAFDALTGTIEITGAVNVAVVKGYVRLVQDRLERLPTAEKRGEWIDSFESGFDGVRHWFRECSECGFARKDDNQNLDSNYCPNCGAKMKESDDYE